MLGLCIISITTTNAGRTSSICVDGYACQGKTLQSPLIECSGFESCDSSSLTSKGGRGYVECTGSKSCNEATSISAVKDIWCQGYYSCFDAGSIDGKLVQCSGAYSCSLVDSITADTLMYCGGWKACEKSCIFAGKTVNCDGLNSCFGAKIESGLLPICTYDQTSDVNMNLNLNLNMNMNTQSVN